MTPFEGLLLFLAGVLILTGLFRMVHKDKVAYLTGLFVYTVGFVIMSIVLVGIL